MPKRSSKESTSSVSNAKRPRAEDNAGGVGAALFQSAASLISGTIAQPTREEGTPSPSQPPHDEATPTGPKTEDSLVPQSRRAKRKLIDDGAFKKKVKGYIIKLIGWLRRVSAIDGVKLFNEWLNKLLENETDELRCKIVRGMFSDKGVKKAGRKIEVEKRFEEYMIHDDAKRYNGMLNELLKEKDDVSISIFPEMLNEVLKDEQYIRKHKLVDEMEKDAVETKTKKLFQEYKEIEFSNAVDRCVSMVNKFLQEEFLPGTRKYQRMFSKILEEEGTDRAFKIFDALKGENGRISAPGFNNQLLIYIETTCSNV